MSHELIMLRYSKRMRKLSQLLTKEARFKAIKSHIGVNVRGGTMGQIEEICQLIRIRDECLLFCAATLDGLNAMDYDTRRLLVTFYIKRVAIEDIAKRCNLSVSSVYRRLSVSRRRFKQCLASFGYDESWFTTNFAQFAFNNDKLPKVAHCV